MWRVLKRRLRCACRASTARYTSANKISRSQPVSPSSAAALLRASGTELRLLFSSPASSFFLVQLLLQSISLTHTRQGLPVAMWTGSFVITVQFALYQLAAQGMRRQGQITRQRLLANQPTLISRLLFTFARLFAILSLQCATTPASCVRCRRRRSSSRWSTPPADPARRASRARRAAARTR